METAASWSDPNQRSLKLNPWISILLCGCQVLDLTRPGDKQEPHGVVGFAKLHPPYNLSFQRRRESRSAAIGNGFLLSQE